MKILLHFIKHYSYLTTHCSRQISKGILYTCEHRVRTMQRQKAYGYGSFSSFSRLEQICALDIDIPVAFSRLTGIITTIGPACDSVETLKEMMNEGTNICRINLSYRNYQYFTDAIKRIREAEASLRIPLQVAVGVDITGAGIRMGYLEGEVGLFQELKLNKGDKMRFSTEEKYKNCGNREIMYVNASEVIHHVELGATIYIEDGPLTFTVKEKGDNYLDCEVLDSGVLGGCMLWIVPRLLPRKLKLTNKDKEDIKFAIEHDVDLIFVSWVWDPEIIHEVRRELGEKSSVIKVIAKIENYEGVKRYDDILKVADGIMIGRGNLGVDISPEKVFLAQKLMIGKANKVGKPVMCATEMLFSMIQNPRPTRAEVADVANAILDGADCVMLSRETARGKHPVKALTTMCAVCKEAEAALYNDQVFHDLREMIPPSALDVTHTTAIAAVEAAQKCHAKAIVVITSTGRSAAMIARYRPKCVIIAITRNKATARYMQMYRGIFPVLHEDSRDVEWIDDIDKRIHRGLLIARDSKFLRVNDVVVLVTGWTAGAGSTNTVRIVTCPDSEKPRSYVRIQEVASNESF